MLCSIASDKFIISIITSQWESNCQSSVGGFDDIEDTYDISKVLNVAQLTKDEIISQNFTGLFPNLKLEKLQELSFI